MRRSLLWARWTVPVVQPYTRLAAGSSDRADVVSADVATVANTPDVKIDGVGDVLAEKLVTFFRQSHSRDVIGKLLESGVHWPDVAVANDQDVQPLAGKTFVGGYPVGAARRVQIAPAVAGRQGQRQCPKKPTMSWPARRPDRN